MWKWINFSFLAAAIVYVIARHAPPFFRQRTIDIQKAIVDAKRIRQEADARAAEVDRKLANIAADIEAMKDRSRREMDAEFSRLKERPPGWWRAWKTTPGRKSNPSPNTPKTHCKPTPPNWRWTWPGRRWKP